jgi:uncharacterized membrane protein YqaE (UPF0057 family)
VTEVVTLTPEEFARHRGSIPTEELEKYEERKSAEGQLKLLAFLLPPLSVLLCGKYWAALLNLLLLWPMAIVPGIVHALWVVNRHTHTFALDQETVRGTREGRSDATRNAALPADEAAKVRREVEALVERGLKIQAIKRVKQATGWDLRQSKDYVDALIGGRATYRHLETALTGGASTAQVAEGEGRGIPQTIRQAVLDRDDYICRYCGRRSQTMEVDHVVPVAEGGESTLENLVTACRECNRSKGGRRPEDAGMRVLPVRSRVRND